MVKVCDCGAPLENYDAFESERLRIHKSMCRSCRADFLEFHEAEFALCENARTEWKRQKGRENLLRLCLN